MAGYTRTDTTNQSANGNTANADFVDAEFDALQGAFNASTGHNHDGSVGSGGPIRNLGPAQDVTISASQVNPKTDNTMSFGTTLLRFRDLWLAGVATVNSLVATTANILGGTINNTSVGATTASTVRGTTITATTGFVGAVTGNATTATTLQNARLINGASFNGSADIVTTNWGTGRTITIGPTGKTVNGSANVSWTLGELGVGTLGTQNSNAVNITGGSISGITDLAIADGGTGASDAAGARTNLGATATGSALFTALNAGAGRTAINAQELNSRLTGLSALDTVAGLVAHISTDGFTKRSITAGAGISVTNGNGLSGNPTVAAAFATQAQAEAGTDTTTSMNPLRTAQAIAALAPVPVGFIAYIAGSATPTGYLKANGAAVSRTTYADLFAAIGTTYGAGNGSTTFNLPDLRGEFIRGWDDGRGIDSGRVLGSGQLDAFQGHWHRLADLGGDTVAISDNPNGGSGGSNQGVIASTSLAAVQGAVTDGVNGVPRIASETRPRNVALLAVIKF